MKLSRTFATVFAVFYCVVATVHGGAETAVQLPTEARAVWDFEKAYRETTAACDRVCLNGLWHWRPAVGGNLENPPDGGWGWFKVPGAWPGITDYMQKDSQTVIRHPDWQDARLGELSAAWQERQFFVPANWAGRSVSLQAEYLNS